MTAVCDFVNDHLRLCDPADEDTRQKCNERHHYIITYIIENIKYLSVRAIWQSDIKIKQIVTKTNYDSRDNGICRDYQRTLAARKFEFIHNA